MAWVRIILDLVAAYFIGFAAGLPFGVLFFVVALLCEIARTAQWVGKAKRSISAAVLRDRHLYRAE